MLNKYDVVQFEENHKWCGCFGIVCDVTEYINGEASYMIAIPRINRNKGFIYSMESEKDLIYVGEAVLVPADEEEET